MDEKSDEALQATDPEPESIDVTVQPVEPDPVVDDANEPISSAGTVTDCNADIPEPIDIPEPMDTNSIISELPDQSSDLAISAATEELLETLTSEAPTSSEIFTSEAGITSHVTTLSDACMPSDALSVEDVLKSGDLNSDKDFTPDLVENQNDITLVENTHVELGDPGDSCTKQLLEPACTLEEELQRLHEGDPTNEESFENKQELETESPKEAEVEEVKCDDVEKSGKSPQRSVRIADKVKESVDIASKPLEHSSKPLERSSKPLERLNKPLERSNKPLERSSKPLERSSKSLERSREPVERSSKQINNKPPEKVRKPAERNNSEKGSQVLERTLRTVEKKVLMPTIRVVQTPIMKDSELEEMLSADEILSDPVLIKDSQEDIGVTDVFVCGKCHEVFNVLEEFQKHKSKKCSTKSKLLSECENEGKSQIWAYTLWKNKQFKSRKSGCPAPSSWDIYKKWVQLAQISKNPWLSAGETLQFCTKISSAKLMENKPSGNTEADPKPTQLKKPEQVIMKKEEQDPLALDGFVESNKENATMGNLKKPVKPVVNKPPMKLVKEVILPAPKIETNKAMRTMTSVGKGEYAVERIVAKRFNAKKKSWEYQIKWEHFPSEDNTWEPMENLNHCKLMVDEFEKQLTKLKAEKAQQQAATLVKSRPKILNTSSLATPGSSSSNVAVDTPNRPTRTCKQKALNQVKAWCGNISDEETLPTGNKRPHTPDSDDSFEKRMKFEDFSDDSETEVKSPPAKPQFRKIAPKPQTVQIMNNGVGKAATLPTTLPPNILIPDANGVVRINQKQLPSLSTGVYIMSKTAGIIKLDSTTSKVATSSGGQTIVKVAPKIGQTQIKIVKKEGGISTGRQVIQVTPNKNNQTTPTKLAKPVLSKVKRPIELRTPIVSKSPEVKKTELVKRSGDTYRKAGFAVRGDADKPTTLKKLPDNTSKPSISKVLSRKDDRKPAQLIYPESPKKPEEDPESDDGLEELPFPDEIKIPEPESPPPEFTLDPFTGKIAGQEYPDIPDPEPVEESKSDTLDNIVKLAAADITEEDLKNEPPETPMDTEPIGFELDEEDEEEEEVEEKVKLPVKTEPVRKIVPAPPARTVVRMSVLPKRSPTSLLNKALTGQPARKSILHAPPQAKVNQRILNPSVARSPQIMNPIIKPISSYVRTKPVAPKPRQVLRQHHDASPKNIYTFSRSNSSSNLTRKIGNTIIRSTNAANSPVVRAQPRVVQSNAGMVQRIVSPKKEPTFIRGQPERVAIERRVAPPRPKTVISMPSLIADDDLILPSPKVAQPPKLKSPSPLPIVEVNEPPAPTEEEEEEDQEEPPLLTISKQEPEDEPAVTSEASEALEAPEGNLTPDMSTFTLADNENPIFITGDDGTVYQVAGQNEQGQTILLTQGSDGQQQCLLVTNEAAEAMETSLTDEAPPQSEADVSMPDMSTDVTEPLSIKTDPTEGNDQVVAQVVRAEPPSPGGTHKVVVMLPDGNLMVTQVSPEEYASLELE